MIYTKTASFPTRGFSDIIDITPAVAEAIKKSKVVDGLVTVSVPGSTAGITTIEYEPGLMEDLKRALEELAPQGRPYEHDNAWGDGNGFAHVRAALMGPSRSFPVKDRKVMLGTWQQIVLIDFDNRPRDREVIIHVMGE